MTRTTTPEQLRAQAAQHYQDAADSFDRCDTDGFVSQWASGLMGDQRRMEANLLEAGGTAEFPALFNLDGELVPAKLLPTQYSTAWAVFASPSEAEKPYGGTIVKWVNAFPKRESTMSRKGYYEGTVRVAARVQMRGAPGARGLSGAHTVRPVRVRKDGGFSRDAQVVDNGR